jgi:hypothetical protein
MFEHRVGVHWGGPACSHSFSASMSVSSAKRTGSMLCGPK